MCNTLNHETLNALKQFAQKHGRNWKSVLREAWMYDGPWSGTGCLRRLRNTHGPSWLAKFKLPNC
jgi:hypothetical protein